VSSSTPQGDARSTASLTDALVLIVEDDGRSRKLVRDVLSADGLRTIEAASGADALAIAAEALPDVILLDLGLPDMNGIDVVRALKAHERTARIPVVALTAMRTEDDDGWLRAAGFSACIEKPIDVRGFPARVRSHATPAST
jgi:two-component system, cell cycle response regulator DivK